MRILLLADDNVTVQRVVALTFAAEAFRVVTVSDGQSAIDSMAAQKPDIVLAGTTMPGLNGYDVARFVRSKPSLHQVPVLLLASAFEPVDPSRLEASGASGVLEKPLEPTTVISRIKELLGIKGDAHRDSLDAAFDSLDHHLAGGLEQPHGGSPSPPLPRDGTAVDPRSRGRRPPSAPADPVFELDHEWCADDATAPRGTLEGEQHAMSSDRHAAMASPQAPAPNDVFEVDDEWFGEDDTARAERREEQRQLAAEMGIHDVELPAAEPTPNHAAPAEELDRDQPPHPDAHRTADDFAALLAYEPGERPHPQMAAPPATPQAPVIVQAAAPEIAEAMLEQIATRVADRLSDGPFADHVRATITTTVRDTVRSIVSETSERLVRDEIARVRAQAERDTP